MAGKPQSFAAADAIFVRTAIRDRLVGDKDLPLVYRKDGPGVPLNGERLLACAALSVLTAHTPAHAANHNIYIGVDDGSTGQFGKEVGLRTDIERFISFYDHEARSMSGSVALSLRATAHPLYSRFTNTFGASFSEATMRPNPRSMSIKELTKYYARCSLETEIMVNGSVVKSGGSSQPIFLADAITAVEINAHDQSEGKAGLDEGLLSFSLSHSRLYGESQ
jgi:hypothetical protein